MANVIPAVVTAHTVATADDPPQADANTTSRACVEAKHVS